MTDIDSVTGWRAGRPSRDSAVHGFIVTGADDTGDPFKSDLFWFNSVVAMYFTE